MVATQILKREVWDAMEELETVLAEPPGVEEERIASVAKRAGNSSDGRPPRPRANDPIGTSRYAVEFLRVVTEVLLEQEQRNRDQERRISELEGKK